MMDKNISPARATDEGNILTPTPPGNVPKEKYNLKRFFSVVCLIVIAAAIGIGGYYYFKTGKTQIADTANNKTQNTVEVNPKIEILATLPPEDPDVLYNVLTDPYSHTAVYSINKFQDTASSSSIVVVNGISGKTYSGTDHLIISPDGKRVAYIAKQDEKEFIVVDGVEGKKYDHVRNLKFSSNGQHIAYAAGESKYFQADSQFSGDYKVKTMFIVIDGVEGKKYDGTYIGANIIETYDPYFSKDGKKVAYAAIKNGKKIIVSDGEEFSDYPNQLYPQFIGDTYDLIYLARENDKYFLVVAGQKKAAHDYISDINGSPYYIGKDSSQIAYEVTDSDKHEVLVNDLSYPISSGILQNLIFDKSGANAAYLTGTWMSNDLYVNGKLFGTIKPNATVNIGNLVFSPDGHMLAYSEFRQKEQNGTIQILTINPLQKILEYPLAGFKVIGEIRFSDDGKYIYFKGWQDRKIVFVTLNVDQLMKGKTDSR